jgi:hypothetical protein
MHISNRHMELPSVVAAVGAAEGLVTFVKTDDKADNFMSDFRSNALVAVLARNAADLGPLPHMEGWHKAAPTSVAPWTDDYSDIMGAILRKKRGG